LFIHIDSFFLNLQTLGQLSGKLKKKILIGFIKHPHIFYWEKKYFSIDARVKNKLTFCLLFKTQ